jgi:hypothetical protein
MLKTLINTLGIVDIGYRLCHSTLYPLPASAIMVSSILFFSGSFLLMFFQSNQFFFFLMFAVIISQQKDMDGKIGVATE